MERLQKFLARAGIASRRHAEGLITAGRVKVNGEVVTVLGTRVDAGKDLIVVDGRPVTASDERHWFLMYKPPGVVTTLSDPQGRQTIADYTKGLGLRVFPVGRLDFDAEGALLVTDDGETANKLMHPKHQVPRVYLAKVKGVPDEASLNRLLEGVRLEDGVAQAVEARIYEKADRNTWLKLVVTEGRQHLIKRLCAAIGHPVVRLFRPAHAGLSVKGLRPGDVRALTAEEVRRVKAVAEGKAGPEPELLLPARRHGHTSNSPEADRDEGDDESNPLAASGADAVAHSAGAETVASEAPREERRWDFTRGADRPRDRERSGSSRGGRRREGQGGGHGGFSRGGERSVGSSRGEGKSGGFSRGGERSVGFSRGEGKAGGFSRGGERSGGFSREGKSGGLSRGGERSGGFSRGEGKAGGFSRGGERSGGFSRGGGKPGGNARGGKPGGGWRGGGRRRPR
ncbi:MAG: pseudouridine synthase [Myxococcota bacterium]